MVKQHSTLKNTPGVNGHLPLPDASKQCVCDCTCLCGWKRGAGCAPLAIGIKPDQFNAMPCTCHSLLFELSPSWPNQLRYHVLPTLNHLGLLHPLKLGSPPHTLTPTTTLTHSNSWLSLIRQQAWNGIWTVHSTYHTCHNVTPECSPHRHMIWALIMEGLLSTRGQQEALQCCTKPRPLQVAYRHGTYGPHG